MRTPLRPNRVVRRARCIERCTPGSGSGPGKRNSHNDCHRVPGRLSPTGQLTNHPVHRRSSGPPRRPDGLRRGVEANCTQLAKLGAPIPRRPIEQTAPLGQRRPVCDSAALAAPRQMPAAGARDAADEHPPRPQHVAARAAHRRPDHPLTRRRLHQLADGNHASTLGAVGLHG
jgi:hypothetical protein